MSPLILTSQRDWMCAWSGSLQSFWQPQPSCSTLPASAAMLPPDHTDCLLGAKTWNWLAQSSICSSAESSVL